MSEQQEPIPGSDRGGPSDGAEVELGLVEHDEEQLSPDTSPEATAEAGLTEGAAEPAPGEDVEFEDEGRAPRGGGLPLSWMAGALRANGLQVKPVEGWQERGRPFSFAPRGVVFHHTASPKGGGAAPSLGICVKGRTDLPGPLCHLLVGRDGTVYVVAAGRANHAGLGGPWRNIPKDSANSYMAGVEVENDGVGEPWTDRLLAACATVFATFLLQFERTSGWLLGHKEWAPGRKIDPSRIDMDDYRRRIALEIARVSGGGGPSPAGLASTTLGEGQDEYVVQLGDTLWAIAHDHGMTVDDLMKLNDLTNDLIHPGDRLKLTST